MDRHDMETLDACQWLHDLIDKALDEPLPQRARVAGDLSYYAKGLRHDTPERAEEVMAVRRRLFIELLDIPAERMVPNEAQLLPRGASKFEHLPGRNRPYRGGAR